MTLKTSLMTADGGAAWTVESVDRSVGPHPAEIPGCVHTDLLTAGVIDDPFVDAQENDVQWVGTTDWTYTCRFATAAGAGDEHVELVFAGLDTLASVHLNGTLLGTTENMHRTYRFAVGDHVVDGQNELCITFASTELEALRRREAHGDLPTASFDQPFQFVRKMACAWGWDWGPTLNTSGVWRDVYLERWSGARIAACRPTAKIDDDDVGMVDISIDLAGSNADSCKIRARLSDPDGEQTVVSESATEPGSDLVEISLPAGPVLRWWPHTMGAQPLYELHVDLLDADGRVLDSTTRRIGFRTIELDTAPDDLGSRFTIRVNGIDLFARGLNWIPDDPLPVRVDRARYRDRVEDFVGLNADVLRVWGGGIYESDHLYEVCDELGVLVWQDFPFACAAYPDELIYDEVAAEARDNINRLMSHASLAIWNGNNENFMGWFEWGWPEKLNGRSWGESLYLELLPRLADELDPNRPYWPGSPYSGSMDVSTTADAQGCRHLWEVWNQVDYSRYRSDVPRFVSEFGWQAPPTRRTIDRFITDAPLTPDSPSMLHHQKAMDGQGKLRRGLAPFFDEPKAVDDWLWAMQLNQCRAITTGIEHFRSHRGVCMGTLWWQFNDCWPVTSWAVIDSEGGLKPSYHAMASAYRDRLVTIQPRGSSLVASLVNEQADAWTGELTLRRCRFDGEVLAEHVVAATVEGRDALWVSVPGDIHGPADSHQELITASFDDERATWFFAPDKLLALHAADVVWAVAGAPSGPLTVQVTAKNLVRDLSLFVDAAGRAARVDRQLVTLLPGESTSFVLTGTEGSSASDAMSRVIFRSANDLVAGSGTVAVATKHPAAAIL